MPFRPAAARKSSASVPREYTGPSARLKPRSAADSTPVAPLRLIASSGATSTCFNAAPMLANTATPLVRAEYSPPCTMIAAAAFDWLIAR